MLQAIEVCRVHQNKQVIAVHLSTQQITTQNQRVMGQYESNG